MTTETWQVEHLHAVLQVAGVSVPGVVLPDQHDVLAGRMRLHYLDWGGPSATNVVFLHGGGLTAHTWDVVCLALREGYRCLALDLRGHGESEWSPNLDYSLEAYSQDVANFAAAIGLEKYTLVGMSLGGLTAIVHAADNPDRVQALALIDCGPQMRPAGAARIRDFMEMPAEVDSIEELVERSLRFNPYRDPQLLRRSLLHNLHRLPNGRWAWKYDRRHRGRADLAEVDRRRPQLWSDVEGIRSRTLIVRGETSDVFSAEDARLLAARMADARVVTVPKAGHTVQGDNPRGLLEVMEPFLEGLE